MKKAVEVGNELISGAVRAMTLSETKVMMALFFSEKDGLSVPENVKGLFAYKVIENRLQHHNVGAAEAVIAMLACLSSTPGECVMYAAAVKAIEAKNGRPVSLDDLVNAFPWGFPTQETLSTAWNRQKIREEHSDTWSDNWLDRAEAWQ